MESHFKISDIRRGQKLRDYTLKDTQKYIREKAPKKYWDDLQPDFDIAAKRRVFDSGYYESLNSPKVELIQDDTVVTAKGHEVITKNGRRVPADVIVLCTVSTGLAGQAAPGTARTELLLSFQGFRTQDCERCRQCLCLSFPIDRLFASPVPAQNFRRRCLAAGPSQRDKRGQLPRYNGRGLSELRELRSNSQCRAGSC